MSFFEQIHIHLLSILYKSCLGLFSGQHLGDISLITRCLAESRASMLVHVGFCLLLLLVVLLHNQRCSVLVGIIVSRAHPALSPRSIFIQSTSSATCYSTAFSLLVLLNNDGGGIKRTLGLVLICVLVFVDDRPLGELLGRCTVITILSRLGISHSDSLPQLSKQ